MSNATQTFRGRLSAARNLTVYNVTTPGTASTEFSQALNANVKQLIIRARTATSLQLAFNATESGTNYITIPPRSSIELTSLDLVAQTLYMQVDQASVVVEILEWT